MFQFQLYNDVWLLDMTGNKWFWQQITVVDPNNAPQSLWCHAGSKVSRTPNKNHAV